MARRYDPVLGRWIYGLRDDFPEFTPPSDEPITLHWDGSYSDIGFTTSTGFTVTDESHVWHAPNPNRCAICWANPGECTHTGWDGDRSTIVDSEEPIRIPPAERAGPAMIGDGTLKATVSGYSWMAVKKKLAAIDPVLLELAKLHAPSVEYDAHRARLVRPECQHCLDTIGAHEEWPCESATILLRRIGLTERDLDYQLGDERDGEAEGGL